MKTKIFFILFIIALSFSPFRVHASTSSFSGYWIKGEYTDHIFPDFQEFRITFWSTGQLVSLPGYNVSTPVLLAGYKVSVNNTLISYVQYDNPLNYKRPMEKVELVFHPKELNMTAIGFGTQQVMITCYPGNETSQIRTVPVEYIQFDVLFDQEIQPKEMLYLTVIVIGPIVGLTVIFMLHKRLNNQLVENVDFRTFLPQLLRKIVLDCQANFLPKKGEKHGKKKNKQK